jgi:outer membrane protein assembly factor BamB
LVGGFVAAALAVSAATAWPRSGAEPRSPVAPAAASLPPPPVTQLWAAETGQPPSGPVAVAADHVVVAGTDGTLRGLDRTDGRPAWTVQAGAGARLAPRIEAGVAYAITAGGTLLAVDAAAGKVLWRKRTGGEFATRPQVAGPRVYAGGEDGVLYAYEVSGDHRRWRMWADAGIAQPPVTVGGTAVVAGTDGRLYGADEFGARLWRREVGEVSHPPVAAGDAVCATVTGGPLTCLRATDGKRPIRITRAGTVLSLPTGGDGVVFAAAADGTIGAWDPATGTPRWQHPPAAAQSAPAPLTPQQSAGQQTGEQAAGSRGVAMAVHGVDVLVAYAGGKVVALDVVSGRERWQHTVADTLDTAPAGDGRALFVAGRTGTIYALTVPFTAAPEPTTIPSARATKAAATATTAPAVAVTPTSRRSQRPPRTRPAPSPTTSRPTTEAPEPTTVPPTTPDDPVSSP